MSRRSSFQQFWRVLCLLGLLLTVPHCAHAASTAPPVVLDPDGDDPRTELLYHWQDKRFSDEERQQIAGCTLFISAIFVGGVIQRKQRSRRYTR